MKTIIAKSFGVIFLFVALSAQAEGNSEMQKELQQELEYYTSCQQTCAKELAQDVFNGSVEAVLAFVALDEVKSKPPAIGYLAFYAALRLVYNNGEKAILNNKMCSNKCDSMYNDIVTLGRKGALGSLAKGKELSKPLVEDPEVINILMKYVKPIKIEDLPANFHNEKWWSEVRRTG